jgi:flavin-binding protein dodecin
MSTAKVLEIIAEGNSIENALDNAVKDAGMTVNNIQSIYVKDVKAMVEGNAITRYRVDTKLTFVLETS